MSDRKPKNGEPWNDSHNVYFHDTPHSSFFQSIRQKPSIGGQAVNPLRKFLRCHGLSVEELSLLSGVAMSRLYYVAGGYCRPPKKLLEVIETAGEDREKFLSDFEKFREKRREDIGAKLELSAAR